MIFYLPLLGKTRKSYLAEGIADFKSRLKHFSEVDIRVLKDVRPANKPSRRIREEEADILRRHIPAGALKVALDPAGRLISSEDLASSLAGWEDRGIRQICFLIGGPLGLDRRLLDEADQIFSLSRMTFTHEMARLLLLEQLYRACNIRAGTGYHK